MTEAIFKPLKSMAVGIGRNRWKGSWKREMSNE
jgi:hypothetical protein